MRRVFETVARAENGDCGCVMDESQKRSVFRDRRKVNLRVIRTRRERNIRCTRQEVGCPTPCSLLCGEVDSAGHTQLRLRIQTYPTKPRPLQGCLYKRDRPACGGKGAASFLGCDRVGAAIQGTEHIEPRGNCGRSVL